MADVLQAREIEHRLIPDIMRWSGLVLLLTCTLLRAITTHDPYPYWAVDPMHFAAPLVGLGPMQVLILDVLTMLAAGLVLLAEASAAGVMLLPTLLALVGAVGTVLHAFMLRGFSLDDARLGATWSSAIFAALALVHACRHPRIARLVISLCISSVTVLAIRGAFQVFLEHPEMVRGYEENKEAYIAAQGWAPGSASVRAFERRLSQPEATGWFGMSNVYASFAAAALVALAGWSILALRARGRRELPDGWMGVLILGCAAAAAALVLARSKGGFGAAAIGLVILGLMALVGRRPELLRRPLSPRLAGLVSVGLIPAALAAIVLRGLVGERLGELSLLFRWFYIQGATRIFAAHPLTGVGPANFKEAYQLAKPPLSPEEVSSPHSLLFDFSSTLGLFGIAWCALWLWLVYRIGRTVWAGLSASRPATAAGELRLDAWFCTLIPFAAIALSTLFEQSALTPDVAVLRVLGLLAWIGLAIASVALMRVSTAWLTPAALGALVLAIHSQIEITPVWQSSAPLAWAIFAAVAAPAFAQEERRRRAGPVLALLLLVTAAGWSWFGLRPMSLWQDGLASSAQALRPVAHIRDRLQRLGRDSSDSLAQVASDLAALTGAPPPRSAPELDRAMHRLAEFRAALAVNPLTAAAAVAPTHILTAESLARLHLTRAQALNALREYDASAQAALAAQHVADQLTSRITASASLTLLATVHQARFDLDDDPAHLEAAADALARADALDPYGLAIPVRIFNLHLRLGNTAEARQWAQIALHRDQFQRLDPLRRMTDKERGQAETVLAAPDGGS